MFGAILAGIGAIAGGLGTAAVGLGSSILGGVGSLAAGGAGLLGGAASGVGSLVGGAASGVGSLVTGGAKMTVGQQMAALAEPAYYETAGGGLLEGVAGISGMLADILPTVGGIMSVFDKPEETTAAAARPGTLPTPRITLPTLPAMTIAGGQQPQQEVFTTTTPAAAKPDYLPYIAIGGLALLMFMRKK